MPELTSPVYAFQRNPSLVDYTGHLAAVFFIGGCNFRCGFCHNPELVPRREGMSWVRLEAACMQFCSDWVTAAVISGGEPTLVPDLPDLVRAFKKYGWAVKLDTNGSRPDVLRACLSFVDYVAMDIKTAPDAYAELTGFGNVDAIAASIALIKAHAADYEFRTTIIEGHHDAARLEGIAAWVRGARRYVLQPFVPRDTCLDPRFGRQARTAPDRLRALTEQFAPHVGEVLTRG
jgi:pyruvate formate lyase activating enzyme